MSAAGSFMGETRRATFYFTSWPREISCCVPEKPIKIFVMGGEELYGSGIEMLCFFLFSGSSDSWHNKEWWCQLSFIAHPRAVLSDNARRCVMPYRYRNYANVPVNVRRICRMPTTRCISCHICFNEQRALLRKNFLFVPCFFISIKFTAFSDTSSESQKVNWI